jgi:hypothetical protein
MICFEDIVYLASNMLDLNYSKEECDLNEEVIETINTELLQKYHIDIYNFDSLIRELYNKHMNLYNGSGKCEGFYTKDNKLIVYSY